MGGAGEATPVASHRQDEGAHQVREVQRPIERRKGGEENRPKGPTAREPAGETRTIESASERPMNSITIV